MGKKWYKNNLKMRLTVLLSDPPMHAPYLKRQGYLDMCNCIDISQTRDYIKISFKAFLEKSCEKYLAAWMNNYMISATHPTPLPLHPTWLKKFNTATGNPNTKHQAKLAKDMKMTYRSDFGEIIWAMTTCHPNLAYISVKLSQSNHCPHKHHYHGLRRTLKYLYVMRDDGVYFWHTATQMEFKK